MKNMENEKFDDFNKFVEFIKNEKYNKIIITNCEAHKIKKKD